MIVVILNFVLVNILRDFNSIYSEKIHIKQSLMIGWPDHVEQQ